MPYITKEMKNKLRYRPVDNCGELNYTLTCICLDYLEHKGIKYQTYNDILGALEGCKLEMYRRSISKYEDSKISENGDVY